MVKDRIVGSSFIGMEVANCLASMKNDVTVVGMEKGMTLPPSMHLKVYKISHLSAMTRSWC